MIEDERDIGRRDCIDKQMGIFRGHLFTLIEAIFPAGQQIGIKNVTRQITQVLWGKLSENSEKFETDYNECSEELFLLTDSSLPSYKQRKSAKASINKILVSAKKKFIKELKLLKDVEHV